MEPLMLNTLLGVAFCVGAMLGYLAGSYEREEKRDEKERERELERLRANMSDISRADGAK